MSQLTTRFQNIYNLKDHHFDIVGCGAIGSYTAMNLVRAGAEKFTLWDFDTCAPVNVGVQHYGLEHMGKSKVHMLREQMLSINPRAIINSINKKYGERYLDYRTKHYLEDLYNVDIKNMKAFVIIGADSMKARKDIFEQFKIKYFEFSNYYRTRNLNSLRFIKENISFTKETIKEINTSSDYDLRILEDYHGNTQQKGFSCIEYKRIILGEIIDELGYKNFDTYYIDARMGSETFQMETYHIPRLKLNPISNQNEKEKQFWVGETAFDIDESLKLYNDQLDITFGEFEKAYFDKWYTDEEGDSQPCNARSTNYCAGMSASFINNQVRKIVDTRSPVNPKVLFSFPSMTCVSDVDYNRLTP